MNRSPDGSSFATDVAMGSELIQAADTSQNASTASSTDVPMAGFGSSVHVYLNQLLTLIYSKTTTLLAANMVLVSLLLSTATRTSINASQYFFYIGAVTFFALSAVTATIVLFPRLHHHDASGLIFWRSILLKGSPEEYYASVQTMSKAGVEEEYSKDNYHISKTIRYKDALLRSAIALFCSGLVFTVIGVVGPMAFSHG